MTVAYPQTNKCVPGNLRCDYLVTPIGVDAGSPRLTWLINDERYGAKQNAYRIIVGTDSMEVANGNGNMWDSKRIESDVMLLNYNGRDLKPFTKYFWSVRVWDKDNVQSEPVISSFETGMMSMGNWKGNWISDGQHLEGKDINTKQAPYFRKEADISGKIKSARAYIAVGGLYELYINGQKIGDHRLDPMFTRFDRRTLYVTYDITRQLQEGKNAIGVLLGNGWYNLQSTAVWYFDRAPWRNRPVFCMDIRITYEDGSVETIVTDDSWKTSLSPVIFNSIYTAEHFDARLEQPGWNKIAFDDSKWGNITKRAAPSQNIVSQQLHPIRNVETIPAKSVNKLNDTTYVVDLGRNISGVCQFRIKGNAGTMFRLKHGEKLYQDGHVDMSNIAEHYRPADNTDPFQTDIFILGGKGEESFMPRFNYKGFQYVEVTSNKPFTISTQNLTGYFMHSDVPPAGEINTSNSLINKIWWAANNSYLSNLFGYPTDCPHREKNGWTGDGQIAIETGLYNFDGITVYEKWLADHRDEQQPNGVLPAIIPTSGWGYHWANGLDWTSTIAVIPWNVYMFYGDQKLLSDCYDNIKRYVDHVTDISPEGLTSWGLGDWVPVKSKASVELTSSVYYFVDATILSESAMLLGKEDDRKQYKALAEKIKSAINDKYLNRETGIYGSGVQTELCVPLFWGVVPEELRSRVAGNLARRIEADNNHIDVGLLGTKAILNALSENGYADLAYKLASQETYPSWGGWIVNGATTLHESWDVSAKSDASMNHIMFGEISAWFYKTLGGIKPDPEHSGFKNILLHPSFVEGLSNAEAKHISPFGLIISKWSRQKNTIIYSVTIPANSTADLYIPGKYTIKQAVILSTGQPLELKKTTTGFFSLKAGSYEIRLK
ncbi:MAG TPA: family 78 glycoside hydrolase catalytic domain [Bacteroidales bacterium]|nr:family 78 glycoside hydrolase catalytic domain [Bacteroidales bacterium]